MKTVLRFLRYHKALVSQSVLFFSILALCCAADGIGAVFYAII